MRSLILMRRVLYKPNGQHLLCSGAHCVWVLQQGHRLCECGGNALTPDFLHRQTFSCWCAAAMDSSSEHNFDRYEIERSFDDRNFSETGVVKARNEQQYHFIDSRSIITDRNVFYQLKMVNKDGATKCLTIIQLHLSDQSIFTIYPNLSSDSSTTIDFKKKEKKNISVSDVYGKIILQKTSINE